MRPSRGTVNGDSLGDGHDGGSQWLLGACVRAFGVLSVTGTNRSGSEGPGEFAHPQATMSAQRWSGWKDGPSVARLAVFCVRHRCVSTPVPSWTIGVPGSFLMKCTTVVWRVAGSCRAMSGNPAGMAARAVSMVASARPLFYVDLIDSTPFYGLAFGGRAFRGATVTGRYGNEAGMASDHYGACWHRRWRSLEKAMRTLINQSIGGRR